MLDPFVVISGSCQPDLVNVLLLVLFALLLMLVLYAFLHCFKMHIGLEEEEVVETVICCVS